MPGPMPVAPSPLDLNELWGPDQTREHRYFFYLIGPPAAGKTSVLHRAITLSKLYLQDPPKKFSHGLAKLGQTKPIGVYLGKRRSQFGGTDALAMNAITGVVNQMVRDRPAIVVGEGDRLANDRMFQTMRQLGYEMCIYHLGAHEEVLSKRMKARAKELGTDAQDPSWIKGRTTKSLRLARGWHAMRLNATLPIEKNAGIIARAIVDRLPLAEETVA